MNAPMPEWPAPAGRAARVVWSRSWRRPRGVWRSPGSTTRQKCPKDGAAAVPHAGRTL